LAFKNQADDIVERVDEAIYGAYGVMLEILSDDEDRRNDYNDVAADYDDEEELLGDIENMSPEERIIHGLPPVQADDQTIEPGSEGGVSYADEEQDDRVATQEPEEDAVLKRIRSYSAELSDDDLNNFLTRRVRNRGTGRARGGTGSYSRRFKDAATNDRDRYNTDFLRLRRDIDSSANIINKMYDEGATFGDIARWFNSNFGYNAIPEYPEAPTGKKGRPSTKNISCPKCAGPLHKTPDSWVCEDERCGFKEIRAIEPNQIADYLKSTGKLRRGEGSTPQDLGAEIPHNHEFDPNDPSTFEYKPDTCPACKWVTSFDAEEDESGVLNDLRKFAKQMGEFTTSQAAMFLVGDTNKGVKGMQGIKGSEHLKANIKTPIFSPCPNCGTRRRLRQPANPEDPAPRDAWPYYCGNKFCEGQAEDGSPLHRDRFGRPARRFFGPEEEPEEVVETRTFSSTRIPSRFRSLGHYVQFLLKNNPDDFQPVSDLSDVYRKGLDRYEVIWKYIGDQQDFGLEDDEETEVDEDDEEETELSPEDLEIIDSVKKQLKENDDRECAGCDQGHHCGNCSCCANRKPVKKEVPKKKKKKRSPYSIYPKLSELYSTRPASAKPFSKDKFTKLGPNGEAMQKQADAVHGNVYFDEKTKQLLLYPGQSQQGGEPLVGDPVSGQFVPQNNAAGGGQNSSVNPLMREIFKRK
jgi:hypothetical protein